MAKIWTRTCGVCLWGMVGGGKEAEVGLGSNERPQSLVEVWDPLEPRG